MADGIEKLCKAGDAAFAPNEAHNVITSEPDTVITDVFSPIRLDHLANHKQDGYRLEFRKGKKYGTRSSVECHRDTM